VSKTTSPTDAERNALARQLSLVRALSKSERFERAMALSALVRRLAWEGASRHVGSRGPDAVAERFLRQLYGPELTPELRRLADRL
jgi:hypothetical protein